MAKYSAFSVFFSSHFRDSIFSFIDIILQKPLQIPFGRRYNLYMPYFSFVYLCDIVYAHKGACVSVCVHAHTCTRHLFIHRILYQPWSPWNVRVCLVVENNHLPPGCISPLPRSPCNTSGWTLGWLSVCCHRSVFHKTIFMQHVSLHLNNHVLGNMLFLGIFRNT